ncbi:MAG: nuclear transport factor 2 family protein [Gammaproteobacteria bacterium]|nr:nuclear transport factor 2 family protein [Gammaproteobacteria bacterium]
MIKMLTGIVFLSVSILAHADYYPALEYKVYGTPSTKADKKAIDSVIENLWSAWASHDATAVAGVHTVDAEWTNAFGRTYRSSKDLEEFLKNDLFPDFDIEISKNEAASYVPISRRYIGSDAAVITGRVESNRGSSVGSSNRKIGFTFVLTKVEQRWKISNQVITDIRERRG